MSQSARRPDSIPLSFTQARLWFQSQLDGSDATYNTPYAMRFRGALDVGALGEAVNDVISRHEVLRTLFVFPAGQVMPRQDILSPARARLELSCEQVSSGDPTALIDATAREGFDLATQLPLRVRLCRQAADDHILVVVLHHVVSDGDSFRLFAEDLAAAYARRTAGLPPAWDPLAVQYADYALWQRGYLGSELDPESRVAGQLEFWKAVLAGAPDRVELPFDRPRMPVPRYRGRSISLDLGERSYRSLVNLAVGAKASVFMVLQAALAVLINRLGGDEDIVVGFPVTERTGDAADALGQDLSKLVGCFVNTLVLRTRVPSSASFSRIVNDVRLSCLNAYSHQDAPFELIVRAANPQRSLSHHPLFQVLMTLGQELAPLPVFPGLQTDWWPVDRSSAKFDLSFHFTSYSTGARGAGRSARCAAEYSADLFDQGTVEQILVCLKRVLDFVTSDPNKPIGAMSRMRIGGV